MSLLSSQGPLPSLAHHHEDAEIEALQTDVMRFMAILGFILSVIFALVQSIPFIPKNAIPTLEHYESIQADIENLNQYINRQVEYLDRIKTQIRSLQAIKATQINDLKRFTKDRDELLKDRTRIATELQHSHEKLSIVEQDLSARKSSLGVLRKKVEDERRTLDDIQSRISRLSVKLSEIQPDPAKSEKPPKAQPPPSVVEKPIRKQEIPKVAKRKVIKEPDPAPKRVGFSLKFESDQAFHRLLRENFIKFYVFVANKTWRVERRGKVIKFIDAKKPGKYHEMDRSTVPIEYPKEFKRRVAAYGRSAATWGVVLPKAMSRVIQLKIKDKIGGDLIIGPSGRVTLNSTHQP